MTKEEAYLQFLSNCEEGFDTQWEYERAFNSVWEAALSQQQWIPIKSYDELPDGEIWVTRVNGIIYFDKGESIKKVAIKSGYDYGKHNYIIAYMPYTEPTPYKP